MKKMKKIKSEKCRKIMFWIIILLLIIFVVVGYVIGLYVIKQHAEGQKETFQVVQLLILFSMVSIGVMGLKR